ncbi:MAG: type III PLP-dependent enzyme [Dehalococcoidia bacterium]|nr:type III PLP-dependent enzyme [Dehalococcoidia bacterium]
MIYDIVSNIKRHTPYLVIETKKVVNAVQSFQKLFGVKSVYYAIKANPDKSIVALLNKLMCNFEVSSAGELKTIVNLEIPASRIISASSIKNPDFIKAAYKAGIRYFTADSTSEIETIASHAPGSKISIRLNVSNEGSEWPLSRKFGVDLEEGVRLLERAKQGGLIPWGLSFHVGSQCTRLATWVEAIDTARLFWDLAAAKNLRLKSLNLGGGFPIQYRKPVIGIDEIAHTVFENIKKKLPPIQEIIVEPGRAIIGHAGTMVTSLIAKAIRDGKIWFYLDVGVFNGLMESIGGIKYPIIVNRKGPVAKCVLAGPSCDGFDVIDMEVELPDIEIGEHVYILSAGAYTTAYASKFDGSPIPKILLM